MIKKKSSNKVKSLLKEKINVKSNQKEITESELGLLKELNHLKNKKNKPKTT